MDLGGQPAVPAQTCVAPLPLMPEPKRHAACDECRLRKLKCSGHRPACDRCARENLLPCVYSPQKQMGRPRKRRRGDENGVVNEVVGQNGGNHGVGEMGLQHQQHHHPSSTSPPVWQGQGQGQRNGSGDGGVGGVEVGIDGMGFGGFEGFGFSGDGVGGGGDGGGVDVFELDPGFSLDPLLGGGLMGEIEGNDSGEQQRQSVVSMSSHSPQNGHHSLHSTPLAHGLSSQSYVSPPAGLSCACLSTIYLTLSSLHSLSSYDFPFVLPPLRSAIVTANTVLDCPHCPLACATAAQNIHGLISLLMTLADAVVRLLAAIDAEAARVDAAGAKKQFMLADASAPLHMHTGTEDCPVRFGMELTGAEWRELARKVVKSQIIGSAAESEAGGCEGTVYGTLAAFLRRQNRWHDDPEMIEVRRQAIGSDPFEKMEGMSKMRLCVQNVEHVKMRMKLLDI